MRSVNHLYIFSLALAAFFMIEEVKVLAQTSPLIESNYYSITPMPVSEDIVLEVVGMAFNDDGQLAVTTRRGEVWLITNPGSDNPALEKFAQGLHEPLGIAYRNGSYFVVQRGELTKIEDRNSDGKADAYKTIYRWPLTGNYHEYSYGPLFLPDGDMVVTLNLAWVGRGASLTDWRGWMLRISEDGEMKPLATGMRSPMGFGLNAEGDIFYADNQGDWIASGRITHLEEGDFAGHPEGLKWSDQKGSPIDLVMDDIDDSEGLSMYEQAQNIPALKLPAVWFPHTIMGISTSDILLIENDEQVGPFAGQLLVGDQGHSKIMRVNLEKVNGEYQGTAFGFKEGFSSGVTKLAWGPDEDLMVGMTSRGWASTGQGDQGIDRMTWNGKVPFEMHSINAEADGFTINFTRPIDVESAYDIQNYQITDFRYLYHAEYGSPVVDRESKIITGLNVADDLKSVRVLVDGLREGYIYEINTKEIHSAEGNRILHPVAYYSLNYLPGANESATATRIASLETASEIVSTKKVTEMPGDWTNGADQTVRLGTMPGLKYDLGEISIKAGSKVALAFSNDDDMLHNFVIVMPGTVDAVGMQAMRLGLDGADQEYIPNMEEVLYHTSLLQPDEEETIYFVAPEEPGEYEFVCTFPGHYQVMKGVLKVTD